MSGSIWVVEQRHLDVWDQVHVATARRAAESFVNARRSIDFQRGVEVERRIVEYVRKEPADE